MGINSNFRTSLTRTSQKPKSRLLKQFIVPIEVNQSLSLKGKAPEQKIEERAHFQS
jgi:hypothetical protein